MTVLLKILQVVLALSILILVQQSGPARDNVVDADFEVVDDNK